MVQLKCEEIAGIGSIGGGKHEAKVIQEEQIISILKENEARIPIRELARKYGFCKQTFYRLKNKFGGMEVIGTRKFRKLEE